MRLVYHTVDSHIATYGKPTYTIFCTGLLVVFLVADVFCHNLFFLSGQHVVLVAEPSEEVLAFVPTLCDEGFANETAEPVVVGTEQMEAIVGKHVETCDTCLEQLGKAEVTALVQNNEQ